MSDLEGKTGETINYNISDLLVLFKPAVRHLPKILIIEDPVIRYTELTVNGVITLAQIGMYCGAYSLFS